MSNYKLRNMKGLFRAVAILMGFATNGCVEEGGMCCFVEDPIKITGAWLLYELPYPPGTEQTPLGIPSNPPQTLTFGENTVSSTVEGLEPFRFYKILTDTASARQYIAFHTRDPNIHDDSFSLNVPGYYFTVTSYGLTLELRGCTNDCYLYFDRIE